jgi:hypothetical protein
LREEHKLQVAEYVVLWEMFGPKKEEISEQIRTLHNDELPDLYKSPCVVRVVNYRWACGQGGGKLRMNTEFLLEKFLKNVHLEYPEADRRVILRLPLGR